MPTFYSESTSSTSIPKQSGPINYAIRSVNREPSLRQIKPKNKSKNSAKWDNDNSWSHIKTPSKIYERPLIDNSNIPPTNEQHPLVEPNITESRHGRPTMEKLSLLLVTLSNIVLGVLTITITPEEWEGFTQVAGDVANVCSLIGGVSFVFLQLSFYLITYNLTFDYDMCFMYVDSPTEENFLEIHILMGSYSCYYLVCHHFFFSIIIQSLVGASLRLVRHVQDEVFQRSAKDYLLNFQSNIYLNTGREIFTQVLPYTYHIYNIRRMEYFNKRYLLFSWVQFFILLPGMM
jgi:hypothetical protein